MKRKNTKIYLLFIGIAFLLYGNTIKNDYALDDDFVIAGPENVVRKGIKGIPKILTSYYAKDESGNEYEYRPIVKISYALEVEFFNGKNVHVNHFFNILYYALCLILLFKMLSLLFENLSPQNILWMVVIFAFLPVHTEVVASLKNRDVMLSFIFLMLTIIYFLNWIKNKKWTLLVYSMLFFLLALLSKLDAMPLIAILPLIYIQKEKTFHPDKIKTSKILSTTILMILGFLMIYFLTNLVKKLMLDPHTKQRIFIFFENPLYIHKEIYYRIITMFNSLGFYIKQSILPLKMSCYYGYNVIPFNKINYLGWIGIFSFSGMIYVFFQRYKKADLLWYGVIFFGISISMFLNFVKPAPGIVADRFLFIPSVGWSIIVLYVLEWLSKKYIMDKSSSTHQNTWIKGKTLYFVIIMLVLQSILIWNRNYEWRYKLYLYEADVKKYPESVKLHVLYASQILIEYLSNSGKLPAQDIHKNLSIAMQEFEKPLAIDSTCGSCYNNIAYLYITWKKEYEKAIPYLLKAYQYDSTRKEMLANIALCYYYTGKNKDTIELFVRKSIRADKNKTFEIPHSIMFEYCKREKEYEKGITFFKEELKIRPTSEYINLCLAQLYLLKGDTLSAISTCEQALNIHPNYPDINNFLHQLKNMHRKKSEARIPKSEIQ